MSSSMSSAPPERPPSPFPLLGTPFSTLLRAPRSPPPAQPLPLSLTRAVARQLGERPPQRPAGSKRCRVSSTTAREGTQSTAPPRGGADAAARRHPHRAQRSLTPRPDADAPDTPHGDGGGPCVAGESPPGPSFTGRRASGGVLAPQDTNSRTRGAFLLVVLVHPFLPGTATAPNGVAVRGRPGCRAAGNGLAGCAKAAVASVGKEGERRTEEKNYEGDL